MSQLSPYLMFAGNAREAMTFYKECLGGKLEISTVGDSPMSAQMPKEAQNNVMHSTLTAEGISLMASDMMGDAGEKPGNTISLCLVCKSPEEIKIVFEKLSAGGKIVQPLKEEFFGTFGQFTDKFGIAWMMQYGMGETK